MIGRACVLGLYDVNIAWMHIDRIVASVGLLMLTDQRTRFGVCAGCVAGMALSTGLSDSFLSLAGVYAVSGMAAGMINKSKIVSGSVFLTQFLFILLSETYQ